MSEWYNLASIGNILIGILLLVGGYMAIRSGKHRQTGEIQDQAISALKAELEAVQRRIGVLERENARLHTTINLVKQAIRRKGFTVTIDGDMVEITDAQGKSSSYSHIQEAPQRRRAGQSAPRSQWMRRPWADETIADLPQPGQQIE